MAAILYRKLLEDSDPYNTTQICKTACDCTQNPRGVCLNSCVPLCPSICRHIILDLAAPPPLPADDPSTPGFPPPNHPKLSLPLKISIFVLVTIFSIFLFFTLYKFYTVCYRSRRQRTTRSEPDQENHDDFLDHDHGPVVDHPIWYIRTVGLQRSVIDAITIVKYKRGEGLVEGTECSVCLNEFQEDETLRLLPKCNHAFHLPCIDTWLGSHTNCPLCRAGIVRSTANSPSPEQFIELSHLGEETQVGISENDGELERESDDEGSELRIGIEEENENDIPKAEGGVGVSSDVLMRRSVSLDSLSASRISAAIIANPNYAVQSDGDLDTQLVKENQTNLGIAPKRVHVNQSLLRFVGSSSILSMGPTFMKRSFSCSGKVFLSRNSRRENSVLPS